MRTLQVNFWTKKTDGTHLLYCQDPRLGTEFTVKVPRKYEECIDYKEMKSGHLTLPEDYSIQVAN